MCKLHLCKLNPILFIYIFFEDFFLRENNFLLESDLINRDHRTNNNSVSYIRMKKEMMDLDFQSETIMQYDIFFFAMPHGL